jgi:hypothetical protein
MSYKENQLLDRAVCIIFGFAVLNLCQLYMFCCSKPFKIEKKEFGKYMYSTGVHICTFIIDLQ